MHILVLGYEGHLLASPSRLRAAADRLGVTLGIESPDGLSVRVDGSLVEVTLHGRPLDCDAIIPRGTAPVGQFLDVALRAAEASGVTVINSPSAVHTCEDKLRTAVALANAGIPQLPTAGVLPGGISPDWPGRVYVKPAWASRGRGIIRHDTAAGADAALEVLRQAPMAGSLVEHMVAQPAATGGGVDYRVLVARGTAVAVIERRTVGDSPVSSGAGSVKRALRPEDAQDLSALGVRAARAVGAVFAGVDVVVHDGQPCVMEVNASPGLEVTGHLTGLDLEELLLSLAL